MCGEDGRQVVGTFFLMQQNHVLAYGTTGVARTKVFFRKCITEQRGHRNHYLITTDLVYI